MDEELERHDLINKIAASANLIMKTPTNTLIKSRVRKTMEELFPRSDEFSIEKLRVCSDAMEALSLLVKCGDCPEEIQSKGDEIK